MITLAVLVYGAFAVVYAHALVKHTERNEGPPASHSHQIGRNVGFVVFGLLWPLALALGFVQLIRKGKSS